MPEREIKFPFPHWPIGDPITPWQYEQLDKNQQVSLTVVGLQFNQSVLQALMTANTQALAIIKGTQGT
ncbi:hypothetical protein SBA4_2690003 [Candidatus Sulfopaludibacter sp. SbA4]|nr:hypothetical protein SBA4_2690003 [Candidatus Sulfopaludibacter sp. SbA4]